MGRALAKAFNPSFQLFVHSSLSAAEKTGETVLDPSWVRALAGLISLTVLG
jgi:hypothetical protein